MTDFKSIIESRTVWANIVGILALGAALIGVDIGEDEANSVIDACLKAVTAASFVASTVFRVIATRRIGG